MLHAEKGGEFFLESLAFGTEREPKIERGADSGLDLVLVENAAGIGNRLAGLPRGASRVVAGALALVHEGRILASKAENLSFEFGSRLHCEGDL